MASKLDCTSHSSIFSSRIDSARRLLDATRIPAGRHGVSTTATVDASRDARGLAIVLIFAAYENLIRTLTQSILEEVKRSRARGLNLKPGLQTILIYPELQSVLDLGNTRNWPKKSSKVVKTMLTKHSREIDTATFPDNGEFMKASQIIELCQVLDLPHPGSMLRNTFHRIDAVVSQRNQIAHGDQTADQIGRDYSDLDLTNLINEWETDWLRFVQAAESQCNTPRHFLRT